MKLIAAVQKFLQLIFFKLANSFASFLKTIFFKKLKRNLKVKINKTARIRAKP